MVCGFDVCVDLLGVLFVMYVLKEFCGLGFFILRSKYGEGIEEGLGRNNGFVLGLGDVRMCSRNLKFLKYKLYESSLLRC